MTNVWEKLLSKLFRTFDVVKDRITMEKEKGLDRGSP